MNHKTEGAYAARITARGRLHAIVDGWSYDRISEAMTTCGRSGSFGVEHRSSGPIAYTCRACLAVLASRG